jgi:hypothetical protein
MGNFERENRQMIRTAAGRAMLFAVATLFVGATVTNCNNGGTRKTDSERADAGSVTLAIRLSPGVEIKKVDYKVTGNGITPITGSVDTTNVATTATVLITGIPAGKGYLVELSSTAADGVTVCGGSATADVEAGKTTSVTIVLQCRSPRTTGAISVSATFNACPTLTSITAAPLVVDQGGTITVGATASDTDAADTLSFIWSAPSGAFANPAQANTTYACSTPGIRALTVKVSDTKCEDTFNVDVTCVPPTPVACGNGTLDPGEECDPPATGTCSADCKRIPVCGDGRVEGSEQCDPPATGTCSATCQTITPPAPRCGDGIVNQASEQCDAATLPTATCSATCQTITPPRCGDGIINQASEQCDAPSLPTATCSASCQTIDIPAPRCGDGVVNQASEQCDAPSLPTATCSATCQTIEIPAPRCGDGVVNQASEQCDAPSLPTATCSATCQNIVGETACDVCVRNNCPADIAGCSDLTGEDKADCEALVACIDTNGCSVNGDVMACYCGAVSDAACLGGMAAGKCKAQVEKAAKSTEAEAIGNRFVDPAFPVGRAANLYGCKVALCGTECR